MKLRQLLVFPVFLFFTCLILYYWSILAPLLKPDDYNSWGKFLLFLQNPEIFQTVGSSFMIRYIPLALVILWVGYVIQHFWNSTHKPAVYPLWTNLRYLLFVTATCTVWILFVAFVQYYNLYYDPTGGIRPGLAGYFAHMASGFGITIILYNINLFDIFQLKGRKGRIVEVLLILAILLTIAFNYEYTEALHPEQYYSELVDMRADIFSNIFGWSLGAALYQMFVPFEE